MRLKYFTESEVEGLNPRLALMLDQLRDKAETPVFITCGLRVQAHNEQVGGVADSSHLKGLGVDIRCNDSVTRYKLLWAAFAIGFKRIEIAPRHLHLDISETAPQNVCWIGVDH